MADPGDLLRAWQDAIKQLGGALATPLTGQSDVVNQILGPLQRQAELLEQAVQRQVDFEKEIIGRVMAPANVMLDMLEQTSSAMSAQAKAFDAAAASFKRAAEMLELQASLLEQVRASLRDPVGALRSAGRAGAPADEG
jgi:hypothetical protein